MKNYTQSQFYLIKELPAVTTYLLNNLLAGSKHMFQVSARNKFGDGVRSYPSKNWIITEALGKGLIIHAMYWIKSDRLECKRE